MKKIKLLAAFAISQLLVSCSFNKSLTEDEHIMNTTKQKILFEDSFAKDWQENWFLEGKKATIEHRDGGLYFAGGTITKAQDREKYHAHHAVIWTKQEFEGDISITFEMTRMDDSDYGTTLVYIQAQGIDEKDIYATRKKREIPAMVKYFNYMNLLSISLRETVRLKRYPWSNVATGEKYKGILFEPMHEYFKIKKGDTYKVVIDKRKKSLHFKMYDPKTGKLATERKWDTTVNTEDRDPKFIEKGRIGLRHMSTRQILYKNLKVTKIED